MLHICWRSFHLKPFLPCICFHTCNREEVRRDCYMTSALRGRGSAQEPLYEGRLLGLSIYCIHIRTRWRVSPMIILLGRHPKIGLSDKCMWYCYSLLACMQCLDVGSPFKLQRGNWLTWDAPSFRKQASTCKMSSLAPVSNELIGQYALSQFWFDFIPSK